MKLSAMWKEALGSLVHRPATEQYPFVRQAAPHHLRSMLRWDLSNCTGCGLCAKDCPANAIEIITLDRKARRFVLHYYVDRCTFCGQCVESCRKGCIELANDDWELASLDKQTFEVYFGEDDDVESVLDDTPAPDAEAPATA
jgi:formate hydrogenlyase subunit 6/NADH:ubiquinone oxidoreductase subunit I